METNLKGHCKIQQKVGKGSEIRFKVVLSKEDLPLPKKEAVSEPASDYPNDHDTGTPVKEKN